MTWSPQRRIGISMTDRPGAGGGRPGLSPGYIGIVLFVADVAFLAMRLSQRDLRRPIR
ncbi:hypothetical protein ABZZ80_09810 [Streptomyces sp. NPDC006356]